MAINQLEQQLIRRILHGETELFGLLVVKYKPRIRALVQQFVENSVVDDLCQDIFLSGFRALAQFQGRCQFYTWLYRIALNVIHRYLKHNHYQEPMMVELDSLNGHRLPEKLATEDTPEHFAITDEAAKALSTALTELPENMRVSMLLREWEGMSYHQIAKVMHCPVGTVRSRIFRARHLVGQRIQLYL
jgi:RNA polymerase sigma-70 factor (ECF subfamily)